MPLRATSLKPCSVCDCTRRASRCELDRDLHRAAATNNRHKFGRRSRWHPHRCGRRGGGWGGRGVAKSPRNQRYHFSELRLVLTGVCADCGTRHGCTSRAAHAHPPRAQARGEFAHRDSCPGTMVEIPSISMSRFKTSISPGMCVEWLSTTRPLPDHVTARQSHGVR